MPDPGKYKWYLFFWNVLNVRQCNSAQYFLKNKPGIKHREFAMSYFSRRISVIKSLPHFLLPLNKKTRLGTLTGLPASFAGQFISTAVTSGTDGVSPTFQACLDYGSYSIFEPSSLQTHVYYIS